MVDDALVCLGRNPGGRDRGEEKTKSILDKVTMGFAMY